MRVLPVDSKHKGSVMLGLEFLLCLDILVVLLIT